MGSFMCRVGWHDWNVFGKAVNSYAGLIQFRDCKRCKRIGEYEFYGNQANPDDISGTIKEASK